MDNGPLTRRERILRFLTVVATYEDDGYYAMLAFGDDDMRPKNYVILQSVNQITEQDASLGLDGVFIECSAGLDGYDLVKAIGHKDDVVGIVLGDNEAGLAEIQVLLTEDCKQDLARSGAIEIFQQRLARPRVANSGNAMPNSLT